VIEPEAMRDHWWWRPGWRIGRSSYTWHVTFADRPDVRELAERYEPVLAQLPMLDPVPPRWLHLTLQGIGFTDEVAEADVDDIVSAARTRCAELAPFTVTIGPAHVDPETIQLPVHPVESLVDLRRAIRHAIADVLGGHGVPEAEDGFRPHVSLAYANSAGPAGTAAEALAGHDAFTAEVTIAAVALINLNRDNQAYEWTEVASVALGAPRSPASSTTPG
jgi:2'-5' RNA ligase